MERSDYEYMANILTDRKWWGSDDNCLTVAHVLNYNGVFSEPVRVIDFFEKPYHYEREMVDFMSDYEEYYMEDNTDFKCPLCDFVSSGEPANSEEFEDNDGDIDIRLFRLRQHIHLNHPLPRKEDGSYERRTISLF